jgi:hypothetical protein
VAVVCRYDLRAIVHRAKNDRVRRRGGAAGVIIVKSRQRAARKKAAGRVFCRPLCTWPPSVYRWTEAAGGDRHPLRLRSLCLPLLAVRFKCTGWWPARYFYEPFVYASPLFKRARSALVIRARFPQASVYKSRVTLRPATDRYSMFA